MRPDAVQLSKKLVVIGHMAELGFVVLLLEGPVGWRGRARCTLSSGMKLRSLLSAMKIMPGRHLPRCGSQQVGHGGSGNERHGALISPSTRAQASAAPVVDRLSPSVAIVIIGHLGQARPGANDNRQHGYSIVSPLICPVPTDRSRGNHRCQASVTMSVPPSAVRRAGP